MASLNLALNPSLKVTQLLAGELPCWSAATKSVFHL